CPGREILFARRLRDPRFRNQRRPDVVRDRSPRPLSACGVLCRPYPERREASRPSRAGASEVRVANQPQDCESSCPRSPTDTACPRRRGDRIRGWGYLAAIAHSRFWHGAANHVLIGDGRFWGEADMPRTAMLPGGVKINE